MQQDSKDERVSKAIRILEELDTQRLLMALKFLEFLSSEQEVERFLESPIEKESAITKLHHRKIKPFRK